MPGSARRRAVDKRRAQSRQAYTSGHFAIPKRSRRGPEITGGSLAYFLNDVVSAQEERGDYDLTTSLSRTTFDTDLRMNDIGVIYITSASLPLLRPAATYRPQLRNQRY
ncbi:hypothetical protein PsYK624_130580 [Phanerochaete sordida]|uniref:Uncharacterized protein n=1 Tax=Phanerochaete sordida TaxID=48140 RepID=A0A9P3LIT1_9APHY|nr:hypothetical protein PsYK624_130580 [Phanerochaete sordida]